MANELTNPRDDDGWGDRDDDGGRVIQGQLIKCVDGIWMRQGQTEPLDPDLRLLAVKTTTILQHWFEQKPVQTIVKQPGVPLPDLNELNAKIPESEREDDRTGEPRP